MPKSLILKLYAAKYDSSFTEDGFLFGAKAQIEYISSLMTTGDVSALKDVIEANEYERLCRRLNIIDDSTKQWLQIEASDVRSARMHYLITMHDHILSRPREIYMNIPVTIAGYHTRYDTPDTVTDKSPTHSHKSFYCTYHFKKRLLPDFDSEGIWTISKLRHGKNFLVTVI